MFGPSLVTSVMYTTIEYALVAFVLRQSIANTIFYFSPVFFFPLGFSVCASMNNLIYMCVHVCVWQREDWYVWFLFVYFSVTIKR